MLTFCLVKIYYPLSIYLQYYKITITIVIIIIIVTYYFFSLKNAFISAVERIREVANFKRKR